MEKSVEIIEELVQRKEYQYSANLIDFLNNHLSISNQQIKYYTMFRDLGQSIFLEWIDLDNFDYELNLTNIFQLFRSLGEVKSEGPIKEFLIESLDRIIENVFLLNSPETIIEMIRCYVTYGLYEQLQLIFDNLIVEWPFIESAVTEKHLSIILIASLLIDRDMELFDSLDVSLDYKNNKQSVIKFYILFYDIINGNIDIPTGMKQLKSLEENIEFLSDMEKQRLFRYSNNYFSNQKHEVSHEVSKENSKVLVIDRDDDISKEVKLNRILKLPNKVKLHPKLRVPFVNVRVKIALFNDRNSQDVAEYVMTFVQQAYGYSEYYITKNQLKELKKTKSGYWIELGEVDQDLNLVRMDKVKLIAPENTIPSSHTFKWPVTEINENFTNKNDNTELNSKSALRKIGYQITGMKRIKRWEILEERAVPELGLKSVAYTIAFLIRGRKAMKNGEIRNKHAITEWEYDLQRLKDKFYRNNFTWPSTNVNK